MIAGKKNVALLLIDLRWTASVHQCSFVRIQMLLIGQQRDVFLGG